MTVLVSPQPVIDIDAFQEKCKASIDQIRAHLSRDPELPNVSFEQASAELEALAPGVLEEIERQAPGFTFMLWIHVMQCEIGIDATDAQLQYWLDQYSDFLACKTTQPN